MTPLVHRIYIFILTMITVVAFAFFSYSGFSYYTTGVEERVYHDFHDWFKPSGVFGHGLGIVGTLLILIGVFGYMARKRYSFLSRFGRLKYWLEFHIFLCTLGPIMILFHTAFKFGGIVSISFWSMVAVVLSGVVGRFIYIQIPRTIEGRELSLNEIKDMQKEIETEIKTSYGAGENNLGKVLNEGEINEKGNRNIISRMFEKYFEDRKIIREVKQEARKKNLPRKEVKKIIRLVKSEISLNNRIERLQTMQRLFKYWHVAHLPFALVMLVIMVIHVAVTILFGYRWIF